MQCDRVTPVLLSANCPDCSLFDRFEERLIVQRIQVLKIPMPYSLGQPAQALFKMSPLQRGAF